VLGCVGLCSRAEHRKTVLIANEDGGIQRLNSGDIMLASMLQRVLRVDKVSVGGRILIEGSFFILCIVHLQTVLGKTLSSP
jgi:hypothetical protein